MLSYIALGSNLEPERHLAAAREALNELGTIVTRSAIYHTEPLEGKDQPWYLNQVVAVATTLAPAALLDQLKQLEQRLGRQPRGHWGSREIDLDILLYENQTIATVALQIPHPGLHQRRCVLVPLAEIAPQALDPRSEKTMQQLLQECPDQLHVERYEPSQT